MAKKLLRLILSEDPEIIMQGIELINMLVMEGDLTRDDTSYIFGAHPYTHRQANTRHFWQHWMIESRPTYTETALTMLNFLAAIDYKPDTVPPFTVPTRGYRGGMMGTLRINCKPTHLNWALRGRPGWGMSYSIKADLQDRNSIPPQIALLTQLKKLIVENCEEVKKLPDSLKDMPTLQSLEVRNTGISNLPLLPPAAVDYRGRYDLSKTPLWSSRPARTWQELKAAGKRARNMESGLIQGGSSVPNVQDGVFGPAPQLMGLRSIKLLENPDLAAIPQSLLDHLAAIPVIIKGNYHKRPATSLSHSVGGDSGPRLGETASKHARKGQSERYGIDDVTYQVDLYPKQPVTEKSLKKLLLPLRKIYLGRLKKFWEILNDPEFSVKARKSKNSPGGFRTLRRDFYVPGISLTLHIVTPATQKLPRWASWPLILNLQFGSYMKLQWWGPKRKIWKTLVGPAIGTIVGAGGGPKGQKPSVLQFTGTKYWKLLKANNELRDKK
jgi:hypothetical protein